MKNLHKKTNNDFLEQALKETAGTMESIQPLLTQYIKDLNKFGSKMNGFTVVQRVSHILATKEILRLNIDALRTHLQEFQKVKEFREIDNTEN